MIPSRLTIFTASTDGNEVLTKSLSGSAEKRPTLGERFILHGGDNSWPVVTGIIERIDWSRPRIASKIADDYAECFFYTATSTYRWSRIGE